MFIYNIYRVVNNHYILVSGIKVGGGSQKQSIINFVETIQICIRDPARESHSTD